MRRTAVILLIWLSGLTAGGQTLSLSGYVKDMQGFYYLENPINVDGNSLEWTTYNLVHHRLNLDWQPLDGLHLEAGLRNRLMSGPLLKDATLYATAMEADKGLVDLSWNLAAKPGYFLNSTLDRLFLEYTWGAFQVRLGRQRINWGVNLVWNPNDLFNAFSFTDFDYEERPGSDALLCTWYPTGSSSLDVVAQTDSSHALTLASRYVFNWRDWDIQVLAGKVADDAVIGGGWSGAWGAVALRGESSLFVPLHAGASTALSATLSADHTLSNSLYVHAAYLFNSLGGSNTGGLSLLNPTYTLSAKRLSMGKHELFAQAAYPLSPLFNLSAACLFNPDDGSAYLSPSLSISLHDNLELLLTAQCLLGEPGSEYGYLGNTWAGFGRLKWSY